MKFIYAISILTTFSFFLGMNLDITVVSWDYWILWGLFVAWGTVQ